MSRTKGFFDFPSNIEPFVEAPLDARMRTQLKSDLTDPATWEIDGTPWLFNGLIVTVYADPIESFNGPYWLFDKNNYTNPDSWILVRDALAFAETVSRQIDVSTTGSDLTGDGSPGNPYATINKALSTLKPTLAKGVTITIQLGAGSFDFTQADKDYIINLNFLTASTLFFKGAPLVPYLTGISATEVVPDSGEYSLTIASHVFTEGELVGKLFSNATSKGDPIGYNTAGTNACIIHCPREGRASYNAIYENATILENSDNLIDWLVFRPQFNDGNINFDFCAFNQNVPMTWTPSLVAMEFRRGYFYITGATGTAHQFQGQFDEADRRNTPNQFLEFTFITMASAERLIGDYNNQSFATTNFARVALYADIGNIGNPLLIVQLSNGTTFNRIMFATKSASNSMVGLGSFNGGFLTSRKMLKFVNLANCVNSCPGFTINGFDEQQIFVYNYTGTFQYFITPRTDQPPFGTNFAFKAINPLYIDDPTNFKYLSNNHPRAFLAPERNLAINIPGLPSEIETSIKELALAANAVHTIVVGDTDFNASVRIFYSIDRTASKRTGVVDIMVLNLAVCSLVDTLIQQNAVTGVSFAVSVGAGGIINLLVTCDNQDTFATDLRMNYSRITK